jgi:hypothetical protein
MSYSCQETLGAGSRGSLAFSIGNAQGLSRRISTMNLLDSKTIQRSVSPLTGNLGPNPFRSMANALLISNEDLNNGFPINSNGDG